TDTETFTLIALDTNRSPVLEGIGTRNLVEGRRLEVDIVATDPDGDAVHIDVAGLPDGATFDATANKIVWVPNGDQGGRYSVEITATDDGTPPGSDVKNFTIRVGESDLLGEAIYMP